MLKKTKTLFIMRTYHRTSSTQLASGAYSIGDQCLDSGWMDV